METKLYNILFVLWFIKIYRAFFFSEGHKMARFRIMTHIYIYIYIYIYIHKSFSLFLLQDCESAKAESGIAQTTMGIYVIRAEGAGPGDEPTDVGVVLEGMEVLPNLKNVTLGCVMLFGLIYALNLNYPKDLKCTFEVFQKVLMELDTTKLSQSPRIEN